MPKEYKPTILIEDETEKEKDIFSYLGCFTVFEYDGKVYMKIGSSINANNAILFEDRMVGYYNKTISLKPSTNVIAYKTTITARKP